MRPTHRSPLFSAVVLAGTALTLHESACGGTKEPSDPSDASSSSTSSSSGSSGSSGSTSGNTTTDAGSTSDSAINPRDSSQTCPDGSELPTPPCNYIK